MPRPAIDHDGLQAEIQEALDSGRTIAQIHEDLVVRGFPITKRTLERRLREWGLQRQVRVEVTDELLDLVRLYFFVRGYSDQLIVRQLQQDGITLSERSLRRLRAEYGMKRRYRTTEESEEALELAKAFLQAHVQQSAAILGFGRGYLYQFVRIQAQIRVAKNQLYDYYREQWPESVTKRRAGNWHHRTNFRVPGPNFMWCLDGYEKLRAFGFEVFGCIDAYSRLIIWIYIGRSATTALSTLKQFLRTVEYKRIRPLFTRSDHGGETPLWVAAQAGLAGAAGTVISYDGPDGESRTHSQGDRISSCHIWGPSKRNVRIERWWRSLREGVSDRWIAFSRELIENGLFVQSDIGDQIAVYILYGPIIREEFAEFTELWNGHVVRKQKNRPHVNPGVPWELYLSAQSRDYGVKVRDNSPELSILRTMYEPLQNIEIDEFLSAETVTWGNRQLQELQFTGVFRTADDLVRPYLWTYLQLRQRVRQHIDSGQLPQLQVIEPPRGGCEEYLQILQRNADFLPFQQADLSGQALSPDIGEVFNSALYDEEDEIPVVSHGSSYD
ncbi:uncharacterized protein B0I36DRAFT_316935 [Microdochium trichocladiopsis]|uniref:Integrase core domain-containing protein n=1 Tax=Microdochium trichocladiopsis TaxID=1682393 RepID=A0A9P8YD64_9PEZI|nr:uncharacterized protein B0I36DRAFT_316935 [Microdochium trichocladiopsis]KAH7034781.1 hypothetical protein B0I36DRAFT_316935 [Microdochium trichocladiopsis]